MPAGRPPKYTTVEEVEEIIEEYFKTDAIVTEGENKHFRPTVSGLAYALNLSRQGLLEYQGKEAFSDTIKRAKQRVHMTLEQKLYGNSVTGLIFNLKNNFGWKDATETTHAGSVGYHDVTEEELDRRIQQLENEHEQSTED